MTSKTKGLWHNFREATAAIDKIARMMEDYSGYIRRYAQAVQQAKNVR